MASPLALRASPTTPQRGHFPPRPWGPFGEKHPWKRVGACRESSRQRQDEIVSRHQPSPCKMSVCAPLTEVRGPKLNLADIRAIVVNLDRRPDRMADIEGRLRGHCPWLSFSRFDASDGRRDAISPEEVALAWHTGRNLVYQKIRAKRKGWTENESYQSRDLELSPGERGCAMSHIRAWRHCLDLNQPLLVLEDDAAPTAEFTAIFARAAAAVPMDAHVLYLGYSQAADWRREVSRDIVESEYVWTTVAYVVWPEGARLMLSKLPVDQPVDNFMAWLSASGTLKSYCVRPKIVRQADAWNVNSDVGHSDEVLSEKILAEEVIPLLVP